MKNPTDVKSSYHKGSPGYFERQDSGIKEQIAKEYKYNNQDDLFKFNDKQNYEVKQEEEETIDQETAEVINKANYGSFS